jgi:hypothetical protein
VLGGAESERENNG